MKGIHEHDNTFPEHGSGLPEHGQGRGRFNRGKGRRGPHGHGGPGFGPGGFGPGFGPGGFGPGGFGPRGFGPGGGRRANRGDLLRPPGRPQRRNAFAEWFYFDRGRIKSIYSAMFYPPDDVPLPNWPPYEGNWPIGK